MFPGGPSPNKLVKKMRRFSKTIAFDKTCCIGESDKGLLVLFENTAEQHWLPKSQISDDSQIQHRGDEGTLLVSDWIAQQKNLTGTVHDSSSQLDQTQLDLAEPHRLYREFMKDFHPDIRDQPIPATEVVARVTALWRSVLKAGGKRG
jgi:hypothetical protein